MTLGFNEDLIGMIYFIKCLKFIFKFLIICQELLNDGKTDLMKSEY